MARPLVDDVPILSNATATFICRRGGHDFSVDAEVYLQPVGSMTFPTTLAQRYRYRVFWGSDLRVNDGSPDGSPIQDSDQISNILGEDGQHRFPGQGVLPLAFPERQAGVGIETASAFIMPVGGQ